MIHSKTGEGYEISIPQTFHNYNILKLLGNGSTSIVVLVEDQITKQKYSAKIISKANIANSELQESINKEICVLKSITHPNIIKIKESFELVNEQNGDEYIVIIMEYCEKGDLLTYIKNVGFKSDKMKKKVILDFLKAVKYLHQNEISHGDIKAENILLDSRFTVKLCDFGFCRTHVIAGDEEKKGTLFYAAPELFKQGKFNTLKADIYSIGITLYTINELKTPFFGENREYIIQQILNGCLSFPFGFDQKLEKLILRCTDLNPLRRPSIDEIINDEYFKTDISRQNSSASFFKANNKNNNK